MMICLLVCTPSHLTRESNIESREQKSVKTLCYVEAWGTKNSRCTPGVLSSLVYELCGEAPDCLAGL
jgi:hypothetical protein